MDDNRKTVPFLPLEIYEDKKDKWFEIYFQIENLAEKNQPIPAELIKEFLSCFVLKISVDLRKKEKEIIRCKNIIMSRFENSDYNFSFINYETFAWRVVEGKKDEPLKRKQEYSFPIMIVEILENVLDDEGKIHGSKEECLRKVYSEISGYIQKVPGKKIKKDFTIYKMKVVTAFMVMTLGYKLTEKINPTNEELFQSTRSALGDFKKNKTPKTV